MDLQTRMNELSRVTKSEAPVVSVYLDTRWSDEHQRNRVRIFLKNEVAKAREASGRRAAAADLAWIQSAGDELISQVAAPDTRGVAIFACASAGLRELLRLRVPFDDTFVVDDTPFLGPLAEAVQQTPSTLVVFVDTESARLMRMTPKGPGEEVILTGDVPGHHSRGGWAQMAQSRYERHIRDHRGRHFAAVTESLTQLVDADGVQRIVLAGEARNVSAFRRDLPPRIAARVVGDVAAARHEPSSVIVGRAIELIGHLDASNDVPAVDAVLTGAAKGRQAVAGVDETVEAVNRGAVHRLYVLRGARGPAGACSGCGALFPGVPGACRLCGATLKPVELGEALVERVLAAGGTVDTIEAHQTLAKVGGVAALLRYPL
ncbi:MAG TPA: Vms1/Ankzf1 family peptidyl-tRNA hydrolase [Terriglobales bacterium]|nr:Vms1/Ankzf1 family peptidyl-tRNA hydrolase [Terriglobales bacterium]